MVSFEGDHSASSSSTVHQTSERWSRRKNQRLLRRVIQWMCGWILLCTTFTLQAQHTVRNDSLRQAVMEKRRLDSLSRVAKRMEMIRYNDSLRDARRQQRKLDSLARIDKVKRLKDSIELQRFRQLYGEEKYQQKLIDLDRQKKQEERYQALRREDSLQVAKKLREQFVLDSTAEAIRNAERQRMMKDSVEKAKQQQRAKEEAERLEKERLRLAEIQRKKTEDSLAIIRQHKWEEEQALKKQLAKTKDSLEDIKREMERVERMELRMERQRVKDSIQAVLEARAQKPTEIDLLVEEQKKQSLPSLPSAQMDSLRKVDSIKFVLSSFRYRLQKSTELSVGFGVSNYLGDLGANSGFGKRLFYDNNFKKGNFFYGVSVTHTRGEFLALRFSYSTGKISASDQDIAFTSYNDPAYRRYKRNLDFQTKISEWSFLAECYPLKFFSSNHAAFHYRVQPYGLVGFGRYAFNPQGSYYDEIAEDYLYIDLQPLHTEGQGMSEYPDRKPYALHQWNIPYGFGVKYMLSRKTSLSLEYVGRKLFTDYLDDVSTTYIDPNLFSKYLNSEEAQIAKQINNKSNLVSPDQYFLPGADRGSSRHQDFYYSFNIRFSFRISKLK